MRDDKPERIFSYDWVEKIPLSQLPKLYVLSEITEEDRIKLEKYINDKTKKAKEEDS